VVAIDLVGPFPTAHNGSQFELFIHNIFSQMTLVFGLKTKADAGPKVTKWIKDFEKHTKHEILCIRLDNAGEFISNRFNAFLESKNMHHEMSIPYEHHQNGGVEWTNCFLLDIAHTFMVDTELPIILRPLAFKQAAYVFNCVAHDGSSKTPFEICMGYKPSLDMVCVFGCQAYFHNITYLKHFVACASPMFHVSVLDVAHGWLLWDPKTKSLKRGALVAFCEDILPYVSAAVSSLGPVLSSIHMYHLGDFSHIKDLAVQDMCLDSVSALLPFMTDAPNTYHQALKLPNSADWLKACEAEVDMILQLRVWDEVPSTTGIEVLTCLWVFALKRNQEGKVVKHKVQIVAQGFKQVHGVNVGKTFAPTPPVSSLCVLLAMVSCFSWPVALFDVKSAFLHSDIDNKTFIFLPPGVDVSPGCALNSARRYTVLVKPVVVGGCISSRAWPPLASFPI
jgi:hypothetical protein